MIFAKIPIAVISEWMCLITSILLFKTMRKTSWKYFLPYLSVTVAIESYGYITNRVLALQVDTRWLYNIFMLIYIAFHIYIFFKIVEVNFIKKICLACLFLLIGSYVLEWYNLGINRFFSTTNTLFSGVVIMLCILYYYSFFKKKEATDILKEPMFWFVSGCLLFYATSTVFIAFLNQIVDYDNERVILVRRIIMGFLNLIMYGCWIKSFICLYKTQASSRELY